MDGEIKFRDLSLALKIGVVGGYLSLVSFIIGFAIGFVGG